MTKICHMTSAHSSDDVRIFRKECVSLAKAGYDTYLIAKGESREEQGVHVVGIGSPKGGRLLRMTQFSKAIYAVAISLDADIYHLHDPELLPYGLKLQRKGKKVVFDSHENTLSFIADKTYIPILFRQIISKCFKAYAVKCFSQYDALVSVTPHIVDEQKAINPNTWQITNYPIVESMMNHELQRPQGFTLCFTGRVSAQWNHEIILSAISEIDNARYVICGLASDSYLTSLSQQKGWCKTDYRGLMHHSDVLNIQRISDAGMALLTPTNNTGGMTGTIGNTKLFEYMMSGLPVICTDFVLWREIIDKYRCGICVNPTNKEAIADAVRFLRDHPDDAVNMGVAGRRAVELEFNWSTQEIELLKLYKELAK